MPATKGRGSFRRHISRQAAFVVDEDLALGGDDDRVAGVDEATGTAVDREGGASPACLDEDLDVADADLVLRVAAPRQKAARGP